MKKRTWQDACYEMARRVADLLISKQHDYGKNNISDFGEIGVLIRTNDKVARLKNLHKNRVVPKNESVDNSWWDLSGYGILALMIRNGDFELPFDEGDFELPSDKGDANND